MFILILLKTFNSIKVRLKRSGSAKCSEHEAHFQFHKGAIETRKETKRDELAFDFQFHKGAIETGLLSRSPLLHPTFNSIKVRLKVTIRNMPTC